MLEDCIKSVLNQSVKTNVVIATSTPNDFIQKLAEKYSVKMIINKESKGIGYDFDFASNCADSHLVTIAHQDDIYCEKYAEEVIKKHKSFPKAQIIFTDYYEIKNNKPELSNTNLLVKRILLTPIRLHCLSKFRFIKRLTLRFGNAICCPAVTFVTNNTPKVKFICDLKCNVDWHCWEKLSNEKGYFIYISKKLMGHRIYGQSTTSDIIAQNLRTKEDLIMFKKFWPNSVAGFINKYYKISEKNNRT